jgi:hypothetical protein
VAVLAAPTSPSAGHRPTLHDEEPVKDHLDAGADHVCIQVFGAEAHDLPIGQWRNLAAAML